MLLFHYLDFISLPFSLYSTFVIEEKFGFNKQTLGLFFTDLLKGELLLYLLGLPVLTAILKLVQWGGPTLWLHLWLFTFVLCIVFLTIYPVFIQPLFNKFTPLEEGELRDSINSLAKKVGFPLTKIYVIDGSARSAHSNAYLYGFFNNKRIVIYDTLMKDVDNEGILAILGHELGHYKLGHTIKNFVVAQVNTLIIFFLMGSFLNSNHVSEEFGFTQPSPIINLILASMIINPVEQVIGLAMHAMSRKFEYEADKFSFDLGLHLEQPLIKIHVTNLGNLCPDSLYSAFHHSHPTLVERLIALQGFRAKSK